MNIRRKISILFVVMFFLSGAFLFIYNQTYLAIGTSTAPQNVIIEKGDNALVVGQRLSKYGIIKGKYFLVLYLWRTGNLHSLVAGVYDFQPGLKIPEVARIITGGETVSMSIPITFPEGWTAKDMAVRLDKNGFSGDDFLALVETPSQEILQNYPFLSETKNNKSLEGYLFPDTYYFAKDASAQDIVGKMLKNFSSKMTEKMHIDMRNQKRSLSDIVIMASIIEKEAGFAEDMKLVGSVFYNRLSIGQRLESDATLEYVLRDNKIQHTITELQNQSPYNTYQFAGLPPGPVSNPGLDAINAAIYPASSEYYFFLTDLKTKKTIFSKNFNEHVANKVKYGL